MPMPWSYIAGTAGRAIGDARAWGPAHVQQCGVWRPKHHPRGFICGQRASGVDALCAMYCAMLHHHCGGRLGGAVAVGMGNTLGPGETGRRCMVISRGASTRGLTGVQCGKRRGPQYSVCACDNKISRVYYSAVRSLGHSLLLHFSAVRLAIACFFLEILL